MKIEITIKAHMFVYFIILNSFIYLRSYICVTYMLFISETVLVVGNPTKETVIWNICPRNVIFTEVIFKFSFKNSKCEIFI